MVERRSHLAESPDVALRLLSLWDAGDVKPDSGKKWRVATASPWFGLLCAAVSFAGLLVFTGVLAGMALTKQPVRMDMITVPQIAAHTPSEQLYAIKRNFDDDPIAKLIDRTSLPEGDAATPHGAQR